MSGTLQGTVRFFASQGVSVTVVREGELTGVLRIPYGKSPVGHPWRAALGLLWDGEGKRYLAWYDMDTYHEGGTIAFWAADVPDDEDPAEHAMALVIRRVHRIRGSGTGPACLFRVTSSGWTTTEAVSRQAREV
jgi:hypothetical protein